MFSEKYEFMKRSSQINKENLQRSLNRKIKQETSHDSYAVLRGIYNFSKHKKNHFLSFGLLVWKIQIVFSSFSKPW